MPAGHATPSPGVVLRSAVIGTMAFLTVVDLFATQAILPSLTRHYGVSPAAMGLAVNASTIGMAIAGLAVGLLGQRIDRRLGIVVSLVLLAVPTLLLAVGAEPWRVRPAACRAGALHGLGLRPDARLSRRGMQRDRRGLGVRGLHHRQCREQPVRTADLGRGRRPSRHRRELHLLRRPQSRGRRAGLRHRASCQADDGRDMSPQR